MTSKEDAATIRKLLRAKGFMGSVTIGRGTARSWIHIKGSGQWGAFTDDEKRTLAALGFSFGGNFSVIAPEDRPLVIARLEGRPQGGVVWATELGELTCLGRRKGTGAL